MVAGENEIRKLYKMTSLFVRSLHTITRLLPVYNLAKHQKIPLKLEITSNEIHDGKLEESILSTSPESSMISVVESVNKTELSVLQTSHGDLGVQVHFRKLQNMKFHVISRSPAIRVPQQVIKSKDIQIRSSPMQRDSSGDWIEMTAAGTSAGTRNASLKQKYTQSQPQPGNIKILTTAHKPSSSLKRSTDLSEFIKIFEKVPVIEFTGPGGPTNYNYVQQIEMGRANKIHVDRWLEELEIEHEKQMTASNQFDLISNME